MAFVNDKSKQPSKPDTFFTKCPIMKNDLFSWLNSSFSLFTLYLALLTQFDQIFLINIVYVRNSKKENIGNIFFFFPPLWSWPSVGRKLEVQLQNLFKYPKINDYFCSMFNHEMKMKWMITCYYFPSAHWFTRKLLWNINLRVCLFNNSFFPPCRADQCSHQ